MAFYGVRKLSDGIQVYLKGMSNMMSVAVILVLAWA
ncbi:putative membrane protein, partial [Vibrio parahaemolyticus V-223/04]